MRVIQGNYGAAFRELLVGVTLRAFIAGQILAVVLCFINSYITLKVGVMDEGYIASILLFNVFVSISAAYAARKVGKITATEAVVVGTMGSAGGSTGFLANFFGAIYMFALETGATPFTFWEMAIFTFVSSCVGVVLAVPMVKLFVIGNPLPWPIGTAAQKTIDVITSITDNIQPRVLSFFAVLGGVYMFLSLGIEWFPEASFVGAFSLGSYGLGIAWSPFLIGAGYLIGLRIGWGFLVGAVVMFVIGAYLPFKHEGLLGLSIMAPHEFIWPGVMALTAAGLTGLVLNLPTIYRAVVKVNTAAGSEQKEKILRGWKFLVVLALAYILATVMLTGMFRVAIQVAIVGLAVGTVVLNIIATLSFGSTGFNPVRVMGILLMVVFVLMGENTAPVLLVAAGLAASTIGQTAIMTQDIFVGRKYKISPLGLMILQVSTFIPVSLAMAWSFQLISGTFHFPIEGVAPKDPLLLHGVVMKMWYVMAMLFSDKGVSSLPGYAITSMWIGAGAGVVLALADRFAGKRIGAAAEVGLKSPWRFMPHSLGITIAMILPIYLSVAFALGALILCYILPKWLKTSDDTLNSLAVAGIVGEGIGAPVVAIVKSLIGVIGR